VRCIASRPAVSVLLPGTGSDEAFVTAVFERPLAAFGIRLHAPPPRPGPDLVESMFDALDTALADTALAAEHPVLVGGISLGAHVAARWAVRYPGRCAGLLLALPAWVGEPGGAAAAVTAAASADAIHRDGLDRTLAAARAGAPRWVADELDRAWRGHGAALADSLLAASRAAAPSLDELGGLHLPAGLAAVVDDPLHPPEVASRWATALPNACVVTTTLAATGRDRAALGRAAVLAWLRAATAHHDTTPRNPSR
jgi:pimeloyl-ACP methyl ester carboxylesterase